MKKLKKFWIAHTTDRWVWRLHLPSGNVTPLLSYQEALEMQDVIWGFGYIKIDYENGMFEQRGGIYKW